MRCGFVWEGWHTHECAVTVEHDAQNPNHCCDCGSSVNVRKAAREEMLRKEAEANWRHYNPDIEELEKRMGETP